MDRWDLVGTLVVGATALLLPYLFYLLGKSLGADEVRVEQYKTAQKEKQDEYERLFVEGVVMRQLSKLGLLDKDWQVNCVLKKKTAEKK